MCQFACIFLRNGLLSADMLKIRLQRVGKKKQAHFRVVLQEHTSKLQGKYLELLGTYDPHAKKLEVDKERVEHWTGQGAQLSATINNLMVNHQVWDRPKMDSWRPKKKKDEGEKPAPEAAPAAVTSAEEKTEEVTDEPEQKEEVKSDEPAEKSQENDETTAEPEPTPAA